MQKFYKQLKLLGILTSAILILHSCIYKEFKFSDNKLDPEWGMHLLFPLFYGDLEFKDFIYDWRLPLPVTTSSPSIQLKYAVDSTLAFPLQEIFSPSVVIDSFNFLIEGEDFLTDAGFKYIVTNGSPYPMFLQMRFFRKLSTPDSSPMILPPAFPGAKVENGVLKATRAEYFLPLTTDQLESFKLANRVEFVSWFEDVPGFNSDTLSAHYPIQLAIVLSGTAHGGNK